MAFNNDLFQKYAAAGQAAWDEEHKGLLSVRDEEPEPQQEDAYSRMVREQYGQRQPQKAAQQTDGATLLDNGLTRGFAGGFIGVPASIASFGAGLAGTDGEIGRKLQGLANEYGRREKDYSLQDIVNDPVEYATDLRSGALYGIGSGLGSTAALYGITKAAAPVLAAAAPAGAVSMAAKVAQAAGKVPGLKYFAENTPTAEFLRTNVYRAIPEAMGQGGAEYDKLIHNEDGSINPDADRSEARKKMLIDTAINIPLLVGSNALESAIGGKFVKDTTGKGIKDTIREGAKALGIEILQNAGEEGAQTTTDEAVEGKTAYSNIIKPWNWSDEALRDAIEGGIGALGQGAAIGGVGRALNTAGNIADNTQEITANELPGHLTDAEQQNLNSMRRNRPAQPGTLEAVEEMVTSFEETRDTRWQLNNDSVNVDNLQDITKAGIGDIATAFMELTGQPMLITSGTDGAGSLHMDGTYSHGTGYKIDVSGNGLDDPQIRHAFIEYCESRGITVLDEYEHPSPNSTGGHLDLEFHGYNGAGSVDGYSGIVSQQAAQQNPDIIYPGTNMDPFAAPEETTVINNEAPVQMEQTIFPERQAAQIQERQEVQPTADTMDTISDQELESELQQFSRDQLVDFAKGIQNIKLRHQSGAIDWQTALNERNALLNRIKNGNVQTVQNVPQYAAQFQKQLAAMTDAQVADTLKTATSAPARQMIVDELQRRIDRTNAELRIPGASPAAPVTPMTPIQQELSQAELRAEAKPNPAFQQLADAYEGDIGALQAEITEAKGRVQQALQAGEITPEQAQQMAGNLNSLYFKLLPLVQQARDARPRPYTPPNAQQQARQAAPAQPQAATTHVQPNLPVLPHQPTRQEILDRAKAAGIKSADLSHLMDVARKAAAGDPESVRRFNAYRPEVQQALNDIFTGNVGENRQQANTPAATETAQASTEQEAQQRPVEKKAEPKKEETPPEPKVKKGETREQALDRLLEEQFPDEEEYMEAGMYLIENPKDPKRAIIDKKKSIIEELDDPLQDILNEMNQGMKQGVVKGRDAAGYSTGERHSNNAAWARKWYKEHNRWPNKMEKYRLAIDAFIGRNREILADIGYPDPAQAREFYEHNRQQEDYLNGLLEQYERLGNITDRVVAIAKVLNEAFPIKNQETPVQKAMRAEMEMNKKIDETRHDFEDGKLTKEQVDARLDELDKQIDGLSMPESEQRRIRELHDNIKHAKDIVESKYRADHPEIAKAEQAAAKKQENEKYHGFLDDKNDRDRGAIIKTLGVEKMFDGQPMTRKAFIEKASNEDQFTPETKTVNGKKEYRLYDKGNDGTWYAATKAEYDYYEHLQQEKAAQELDKGSNVTKAAENKKAVSVETNIANGKKALERVIETHEDVENAMYREDVGDIDFVWGNEGTKEKDYENGYGIAKIIKKHGKEDAMKIPSVIATGNVVKRSENRMTIDSADDTGMRVIIRFDWDGKRRNWLLTGYTKNKSQSSPVTDDRRVTDTASRTSSAAETTDFPANTIPQNQQESKSEASENAQDNYQRAVDWMAQNNGGSVTGLRLGINVSREEAIDLMNRMAKDGIISEGGVDERRDFIGKAENKAENQQEQAEPEALAEKMENAETEPVAASEPEPAAVNEPEIQNLFPAEEVPDTMKEKSASSQGKIVDFGQKIGGARKDFYEKGEKTARPKTEKKPDDGLKERPWLRAYEFKQGEDGQWKVIHKASAEARQRAEKMDSWIMGFNLRNKRRGVESLSFDSLEAAQKAATIDALNEKHRLSMRGSGENASYYIARRIGGQGGHWFTIKTGFKTEQEAKEYMANHAEEIMKIKTSFGEGDIVKPEIKGWNDARKGKAPQRLKENQNATAKMFADTFGFRGVQFGNWENQVERQSVMNAAYEGMLDLADMLGVEPKIVSLNGELGLAFGARGKGGKNSAAAHYEPGYTVINLTKMSGAGTLAHEWMHALDHYLMIKGGAIKNDRNSDGKLTDASFNRLASEEGSYSVKRLNLPEALKEAFIKLNNAIRYKEVVVQEDAKDAREWVNKASEAVDKKLNEIRAYLAKDRQYGSKKTAATEDQLKQFDEIAAEIAAADGEVTWNWQLQDYTSPAILKLSALHKEVTGRALITKNNKSSSGSALTYHVHWLQKRRATLAEALAKTDKVKQVPTTYYQNASDIDQGRSSVYWATRPEMLARAFSSMIEDTADAREYGSYFLSYGSDNRMYWFGKPFPEGAEREAINKAFGEFFTEVQKEIERNKKETGEIRFSVRATDPKYQSGYRQQHEAAMQAYGEDIKKVTDSITAEVKDAYPGAKDFKVDGDNVTFTMPNGVNLHVSIKDRIILNADDEAKARQAHGLNDSNDIVVEGYSRKLDDGSVVVLSAESSKGTTYHEALHTVRDWCLTEKENADLEKYYGKQAAAQGVSVDEAIADGYKEWKLARAKGSGTLFGKLYKKMSDFIDTVKAIFKGMTDVHEIYKKIESGEIWNRDAQGRFIARAGIQAQAGYSNPESRVEMPIVDAQPFVETEKFHKQVDDREAAWRKILEDKELEAVEWKLPNGHTNVISRSLKGGNWQLSWFDRNGEAFGDTQAETPVEFLDRDSTDFLADGKQIVSVLRASDLNSDHYSIREKTMAAAEKLTKPEPVRYGNDSTAFGRVTQKISGATEKSAFQKGMDFFHDFYFNMFDEDTHAHELDKTVEKRTGVKPTDSKSFYESVRMAGSLASGHVTGLIAGNRIHGETVQSRLRSTTLQEQFDPDATLQNMMDIIDPEKMNAKYKDFLVKYDLRDWQQALDTYLAAWRLKEMYNLSLEEYGDKHRKWRDKRDKARAAGKEFKEPEPRIYRLPGNLTISDVNTTIKAAPPEMEQAAKVYYAFNKNMTVLLADAGLITPKLYHLLNDKYKRYCPLMRDFSDTAAADQFITSLSKGGDSVVNVSYALKEILESGSKRNLLSPLESTIKAAAVICDKAERNKVGQMAVRMAAEHKLNDLIWKVDDKKSADPKNCIFTVMFNGEKVAYQCVQELYEPIVGCPEPYTNMLLNTAAIPARWLRTGSTISPTFSIRNAIKDTLFAGASSKNGFIPIYDTVRGFMALRNNPKMKAQFEAMGVPMYTFFGNEIAAAKQLKDLHIKEPETLVQWLQEIRKNPWTGSRKALEKIAELSEQSTRMGEFQRAIENGKSLEDAARAARNVTLDFSRHGRTGKYINQVIPFFNACLQGSDKLYHLIKEDPVGTTTKLAVYITLPSVILWTINHDKDWWRELDPDLKNNNWFLETSKGIVRIPKPQEAGVLFGSGMEALLEQASRRDPVAMTNWAWAMFDAIKPNFIPTVILPLLENYVNISFFRMKPIVSKRNEKLPGEQQYTGGTSELSKMIGGSAPVKAVVKGGYSPSKIDNFIRGYTGTMGSLLWQGVGEATNRLRGKEDQSPAKNWQEMPFVREFFVNPYSISRSVNDFYDLAAEAEVQHNGYGKKGKPSAAVVGIRKARTLIANERKEIQKITGNKHFTPERKREMIDQRQERIKTIAEKALEKYRDKL